MTFLLSLSRGIDWLTTAFGKVMYWLTLFMVLIGGFNVIARYAYGPISRAFGDDFAQQLSSNVYLELQTYAYNLVFLLGAAFVLNQNAHVRVDIIFTQLGPKARAWVDVLGTAFFLIPFSLMGIYFSQSYIARSWRQLEMSPNPGGLPRYPIKTIILIAFALLIVQGISEIIKNVAFIRGRTDSKSVHDAKAAPPEQVTKQVEVL